MGALAVSRGFADARHVMSRMLAAVPHRGSDTQVVTSGDVTIGIRYDPTWRRAWVAREGARVAAISGTLDDLDDIASTLGTGPLTRRLDPAQLLLQAWSTWGIGTLERLRGQFALVVHDEEGVTCARDQFGFRPLFVWASGHRMLAGSEIKQLVAGGRLPDDPDLEHLERVLYGGIGTSTSVRSVERVRRGSWLRSTPTGTTGSETYWDPAPLVETLDIGPREAQEELARLLRQATLRSLRGSDVILLSGGLDSPSLAAFAARTSLGVQALGGVYPDHPEVDERPWIEMVTDHLDMPLRTWKPDAGALDDLDLWLDRLDGPVDTLSIPECADAYREARAIGGRTVLTGELAENVLDGRAYLLDHLVANFRWKPAAAEIRERRRHGHSWSGIGRTLLRATLPSALLNGHHRRNPRTLRIVPPWMDHAPMREREALRSVSSARRRWRNLQTASFTGSAMGFEADEICSAYCGVEVRRPFADVDLWEFALSLPAEVKSPPILRSKALLRAAMRPYLPDALLDRTDKTVFDEYQMTRQDHPALIRIFEEHRHEFRGIDYPHLLRRLRAGELDVIELHWARDLARVQRFADR